jgi:hypothetical protein
LCLTCVQSAAIARFLAHKGGLLGSTDADYATSEMLLEEFADVYGALAKVGGPPHLGVAHLDSVVLAAGCVAPRVPSQRAPVLCCAQPLVCVPAV